MSVCECVWGYLCLYTQVLTSVHVYMKMRGKKNQGVRSCLELNGTTRVPRTGSGKAPCAWACVQDEETGSRSSLLPVNVQSGSELGLCVGDYAMQCKFQRRTLSEGLLGE